MLVIELNSSKKNELIDITKDVSRAVEKSGVREGICFVYVPHTTAAVTINEGADPDVAFDINETLKKIVPENGYYRHIEGNSDAHVKSSVIGCELFVIVQDGKLVLGRWQRIFFCEFDGPRRRKIYIKVVEG